MGCVLILKMNFIFFMQLSKMELEVSRGTYFSLECFQSMLFPPVPRNHLGVLPLGLLEGQSWWKDSNTCTWAAFGFVRFADKGGGISALPDLADFSPTLLSVCCSKYQMMRNSLEPASPGSKAASFRQILAVSQCRAVSPDTNEWPSSAI